MWHLLNSGGPVPFHVSRDCAGHTRADAVRHLAGHHLYDGGDGGHEVHHLYVRSTGAKGQSGSRWRCYLHYCRSVTVRLFRSYTPCPRITWWICFSPKVVPPTYCIFSFAHNNAITIEHTGSLARGTFIINFFFFYFMNMIDDGWYPPACFNLYNTGI